MSKPWIGKLIFGLSFIAVAAVGGAFIAHGVTGLLSENKQDNMVDQGDRPIVPVNPNNPQASRPNRPVFSPESQSFKPNIGIEINTQPITWGRVLHNVNRPDEYPCDLQYRNLVKIKSFNSSFKQGLLLDFYYMQNSQQLINESLLLEALRNIQVDGYVSFEGASNNSSGIDGNQTIQFDLGGHNTLYDIINNRNFINMSAKNSKGDPVPPSSIMVQLTYPTDIWYFKGDSYKFNIPNDNSAISEVRENYFFPVNISGYDK